MVSGPGSKRGPIHYDTSQTGAGRGGRRSRVEGTEVSRHWDPCVAGERPTDGFLTCQDGQSSDGLSSEPVTSGYFGKWRQW